MSVLWWLFRTDYGVLCIFWVLILPQIYALQMTFSSLVTYLWMEVTLRYRYLIFTYPVHHKSGGLCLIFCTSSFASTSTIHSKHLKFWIFVYGPFIHRVCECQCDRFVYGPFIHRVCVTVSVTDHSQGCVNVSVTGLALLLPNSSSATSTTE